MRSPTWWVEYTDHAGTRRQAKGFKTREATLQLERTADAVRAGIETDSPAPSSQMIDHVPAYKEHVARRSQNESHRREAVEYVRQILVGAALTTPASVNTEHLQGWLQREAARPGTSKVGSGKRKPWSQRTLNHRITKLKAFGNWLVRRNLARWNPFAGLVGGNAEADRRHVRRALEHVELLCLVAAARESTREVFGLSGPDRAVLYLFAAYTGFRCRALASLTPESIEWVDGLPAVVTVSARAAKNGRQHSVPFHPDVGRQLSAWLARSSNTAVSGNTGMGILLMPSV